MLTVALGDSGTVFAAPVAPVAPVGPVAPVASVKIIKLTICHASVALLRRLITPSLNTKKGNIQRLAPVYSNLNRFVTTSAA